MAKDRTGQPQWPTAKRMRFADGRVSGTDGSVWLYRTVRMAPVSDAKSPQGMLAAAGPIMAAFEELASLSTPRLNRRSAAKGGYRQVHLLLVNIPQSFRPDPRHPLHDYLVQMFPRTDQIRRLLLFGVKLNPAVGGAGGLKGAIDSVVESLASGTAPMSDFDKDFARVDARLAAAGLSTPGDADFRLADAWWNYGRYPDTPLLVHSDHLHVFASAESARSADRLGRGMCASWPPISGHHPLTFATVQNFDAGLVSAVDPKAHWVPALLRQGAVAVSVRGLVEPPKVTREELRRMRKKYIDDINERAQAGKMERAEQEEMLAELTDVEAVYAQGGPPTLVESSIIVAFDGDDQDRSGRSVEGIGTDHGVRLNEMVARQEAALAETWICSPVRSSPHLHDLPAHMLACSGLPSLSTVGDETGMLLGFTETDRQPAYISPTAAADEDSLPILVCVGQSGSGKSASMLWLADQAARILNARGQRTPVVIIDPKLGSDHSEAVRASDGQVASLDNLMNADGVFDPIRFSQTPEVGVEIAASMLMSINPWGPLRDAYEVPLISALSTGMRLGAQCTGQALLLAQQAGKAPQEMVEAVFALAEASPMFRACFGVEPGTTPLRTAEGITLIKVGNANLDLPEPGQVATATLQQRVALALVRMMVFGSAMALTGRQGIVALDEAWVFLGAGRSEVERLGRLARSQGVLPMLFTQRVTDALNAGLAGYISRGIILPIQDPDEAAAACELFKLAPTPQRMQRLTAKASLGESVNWGSMRALRDPVTGRVLRGAVGIYADLSGRAVPVEVEIPPDFLARASTNPEDIRRRERQAARSHDQATAGQAAPDQAAPVTAVPAQANGWVTPDRQPPSPPATPPVPTVVGGRHARFEPVAYDGDNATAYGAGTPDSADDDWA